VRAGEETTWARIWRASERRAERVSLLEECARRVVMRVVREAVRVWVAGSGRITEEVEEHQFVGEVAR
jgi:hypothetical protein